jgi:hypothetical protein
MRVLATELERKRTNLEWMELMSQAAQLSIESRGDGVGMWAKLQQSIVDAVVIEVSNVHVVFQSPDGSGVTIVGAEVEHATLMPQGSGLNSQPFEKATGPTGPTGPTDDLKPDGDPNDASNNKADHPSTTVKSLSLTGVSVYTQTHSSDSVQSKQSSPAINDGPDTSTQQQPSPCMASSSDSVFHKLNATYLLAPCDLHANLRHAFMPSPHTPQFSLDANLGELLVCLDVAQLTGLAELNSLFNHRMRTQVLAPFRPSKTPFQAPREWWVYSVRCARVAKRGVMAVGSVHDEWTQRGTLRRCLR